MNPVHEFRHGNPKRVIQRTVRSHRHDGIVILKLRPIDVRDL